jgi:hypothetical protein
MGKNFYSLIASFLPAVTIASGASAATEDQSNDSYIEIEASDLALTQVAVRELKAAKRDLSCFVAQISRENGLLRIDFLVKVQLANGNLLADSAACGGPIAYIIDANGKIVRRVYSR